MKCDAGELFFWLIPFKPAVQPLERSWWSTILQKTCACFMELLHRCRIRGRYGNQRGYGDRGSVSDSARINSARYHDARYGRLWNLPTAQGRSADLRNPDHFHKCLGRQPRQAESLFCRRGLLAFQCLTAIGSRRSDQGRLVRMTCAHVVEA